MYNCSPLRNNTLELAPASPPRFLERERERNFRGSRPLMGSATDHHPTTRTPSGGPIDPPVLKPYQSNIRTTRSHPCSHAGPCARIVLFLEFQHAIDPSICYHISTCTYHNYTIPPSYGRLTSQPKCELPRRRHAATISAQIYYTPTLDSVIVAIALPAATAAPPSSRQPTRTYPDASAASASSAPWSIEFFAAAGVRLPRDGVFLEFL